VYIVKVPNHTDNMNSRVWSACYPRRNFYPFIDDYSIINHRITMPYLRICATFESFS